MFKIISDSCCDLNDKLKKIMNISIVPLNIQIGNKFIKYGEGSKKLLEEMKNSLIAPKTSSPSPQKFIDAYKGIDKVFVVTLSSKLSSTYNNAMLAKDMFLEEVSKKFIHVFDSKSAAIGQTLVSLKLYEYLQQNLTENDIVEKVNQYIKEMKTFFILDSFDNLIKSGRISKLAGKVATSLSINPIMRGNDEGDIELVKKVRGTKKALAKLVEIIEKEGINTQNKILGITYCDCYDKAKRLKEMILEKIKFKDIVLIEAEHISSVYADSGGIVIAF